MGKTVKRLAIWTTVIAGVSYVAGVLTAPKSGKQLRTDLKKRTFETKTQAERQLKTLHTELGKAIDEAKTQAETAKGKAKTQINGAMTKTVTVKEKARQLISALHEGDADDSELRKAIDEANEAIAHLRDYLKK